MANNGAWIRHKISGTPFRMHGRQYQEDYTASEKCFSAIGDNFAISMTFSRALLVNETIMCDFAGRFNCY
jgi:hypothetical protein